MSTALARLADLLRAQGGLTASLAAGEARSPDPDTGLSAAPAGHPVAPATSGHPAGDAEASPLARLAAAGPLTQSAPADYELVIEAIYEGYLLHYGTPRVAHTEDSDLGLLVGDQLYALGLARLVALGDLAAVTELADVISLSALAQAAGAEELAGAVWAAGARAVGWGASPEYEEAKALIRSGAPEALAARRALAAL
jgi:hypothetical protein